MTYMPYTGRTLGPSDCPKVDVNPSAPTTVIQNGHAITELAKILTKDEVDKVVNGQGAIFLAESLEYKDIFPSDPVHQQYYCAMVVPNDVANNVFSFITMMLDTD